MLVRSTNHAASLDTAAGPKIGEGARPVVAPRLEGSRRCAGHAAAAAGHSLDARCASKFTRDDHQHPFVQTASADNLRFSVGRHDYSTEFTSETYNLLEAISRELFLFFRCT